MIIFFLFFLEMNDILLSTIIIKIWLDVLSA